HHYSSPEFTTAATAAGLHLSPHTRLNSLPLRPYHMSSPPRSSSTPLPPFKSFKLISLHSCRLSSSSPLFAAVGVHKVTLSKPKQETTSKGEKN
ncbi:hypothetical protein A2U01_0049598, partial [Trifolium medium]|nr:hypothetical protein [Trifolium medium]